MPSVITSLVTIRFQWVRIAGLERLLGSLADNRNPSLTGTLVLPATRYEMSDSSFVEVAFNSPALELEGVIFVPRAEVIAILKTADPEHLPRVGYKGRAVADHLEAQSMSELPTPDFSNLPDASPIEAASADSATSSASVS